MIKYFFKVLFVVGFATVWFFTGCYLIAEAILYSDFWIGALGFVMEMMLIAGILTLIEYSVRKEQLKCLQLQNK